MGEQRELCSRECRGREHCIVVLSYAPRRRDGRKAKTLLKHPVVLLLRFDNVQTITHSR